MIKYKIDVFRESSNHGFNQTRIQKENLLPRQTITNIKAGKNKIQYMNKKSDDPKTEYIGFYYVTYLQVKVQS